MMPLKPMPLHEDAQPQDKLTGGSMRDRLSQILNFLEALDPFKALERTTYLSNHPQHESDSDHTPGTWPCLPCSLMRS
ncbi:MAG: hypothetical protein A2Z14_06850 [Chloroflexi bacterium RBG_16_48_8]|nr:MAG: hypothetical protein A2Z14_06850 [Chloroflexi bacterium RBG_16_48_8]